MVLVVLELLLLMVGRGVGGVVMVVSTAAAVLTEIKTQSREEIHCFVYA